MSKIITTMDSVEVDKLFKEELYALYARYQLSIGTCGVLSLNSLSTELAYDDEGVELTGLEAVRHKYKDL